MKNITALKILVIIVFTFAAIKIYSQETGEQRTGIKSYGFTISPQAGFVYGQALEYVYPANTKGELLSELRWDMKPVFYLGLQAEFGKKDMMSEAGFFSSLSFKIGIPGDSGVMEDRDWQSIENSALTNFSSHTNKTRQFFSLDASIGATVPVKTILLIKPFISGSWMHFGFTGRDGSYKYARDKSGNPFINTNTYFPIDDNPHTGTLKGDVIKYKQDWLLLSPGIAIGLKAFYPFSVFVSFGVSLFTYCSSRDDHLDPSKQETYLDFTNAGLLYEPSVSISYSFKRIEHSIEFSYRHIGKTRGDVYQEDIFGYIYFPNRAGAGLSMTDMRYLLKIHL